MSFASGQRYNIIVEANPDQFTSDQNFWIRTTPAPNCTAFAPKSPQPDEHTGIVRYTFNDRLPTTSRQKFTPSCADETYRKVNDIKPIVNWTVSKTRHGELTTNRWTFYFANADCIQNWTPSILIFTLTCKDTLIGHVKNR